MYKRIISSGLSSSLSWSTLPLSVKVLNAAARSLASLTDEGNSEFNNSQVLRPAHNIAENL